jgi:hypothetical protein
VAGIFRGQKTWVNKDQVNTAEWLRRGATAMAAGRVGLGLAALARPALLTGAWVGPPGDSPGEGLAGRVLGRALGARDLALGLGTLAALQRPVGPDTDQAAKTWVSLSALADGADLLVTLGAWSRLPARQRWLVAAAAGGAAALGLSAVATA